MFKRKSRRIDPQRVVLTDRQVKELEETRRFYEKLREKPRVTHWLMRLIFLFWMISLAVCSANNPTFATVLKLAVGTHSDPLSLLLLGAKNNFLIDQGQVWRFVSPLFLHFGLLHLLFNGYALYLLGRIIENLYGRRRFLLIFFFSGVASIVASYFATPVMSVGASGAIFGLLGAATVVGYKYRTEIPFAFRRFFGRGMVPWIALNLALGLFIDGIDNYAHVGGLLAGVLVSLFLDAPMISPSRSSRPTRILLTFSAAAAVLCMAVAIIFMGINVFDRFALPLPKTWRPFSEKASGIRAEIPSELLRLPAGEIPYGAQFVEPNLRFSMAVEFEPGVVPADADLLTRVVDELAGDSAVDADSILVLREERARLGGLEGRYVRLRFRTVEPSYPYELETRLAATSSGLYSATCFAPKIFYSAFGSWCDEFFRRLAIDGPPLDGMPRERRNGWPLNPPGGGP